MNQLVELDTALLNKLTRIHSWNRRCTDLLSSVASTATYNADMSIVEQCLQDSTVNTPITNAHYRLPNIYCQELFNLVIFSSPLFSLFQKSPLLSKFDPEVVAILINFSDVTPNSGELLQSDDPIFMRILDLSVRQGSVSAHKILNDDLGRLITVYKNQPDIFNSMYSIAISGKWASQMRKVENKIENSEQPVSHEVLEDIFDGLDDSEWRERLSVELDDIFLRAPRFSKMLSEEVLALWEIRKILPSSELSEELNPSLSAAEEGRAIAVKASQLLQPKLLQSINLNLELRIQSVEKMLRLRKFSKLDALSHCWPELARLLVSTGRSELIGLEEHCIQPNQPFISENENSAKQTRWERYQRNEQLVRFLHLRPLFRDIFPDEVKQYLKASQAVAKAVQGLEGSNTIQEMTVSGEHIANKSTDLYSTQPIEIHSPKYQEIFFDIQHIADKKYKVHLKKGSHSVTEEVSMDWEQIESQLARPQEVLLQVSDSPQATRAISYAENIAVRLKDIGSQLFDILFTGEVRKSFIDMLQSAETYRIIWEVGDRAIIQLPLETLYVPAPSRRHLALSRQYSMVRRISDVLPSFTSSIRYPLRVLAVFSNPDDTAPLNIEKEAEILTRTLGSAIQQKQVQLEVLRGSMASYSHVGDRIKRFQPHVFHFVGHGVYYSKSQQGGLILTDDNLKGKFVSSDGFASLLEGSEIKLVVLNACDTGVAALNDAVTGVAGALINSRIPSVIATTGAISDEAAIMFTREFYRFFIDGYDVESSVIETRKLFSVENLDWSVYALFNGTTSLSNIKLSS